MLIGNGKVIVEESNLVETFKGAATDMRYFAKSMFFRS